MKVKIFKLFIFFIFTSACHAGTIHHTLISITEQKILGRVFKHVMTCGGIEKDEFFIDGRSLPEENYAVEYELALKKEQEQQALQRQELLRARLHFVETVQVEIAAKLLYKILDQTVELLHKVSDPVLENFFVFNAKTIDSQEQLHQLRNFTQQLGQVVEKKIENNDFEGLNLLYSKLELWPNRLEKFFQDTVQYAIKKSDDTVVLKELLKLVSEFS